MVAMLATLSLGLASFLLAGDFGNVAAHCCSTNTTHDFQFVFSQQRNLGIADYVARILPISKHIKNKQCREDSEKILKGFKNLEPWALQIVDASAKLQSGILTGNIKNLGQYEECVEARAVSFRGQYCLANVLLKPQPGSPHYDKVSHLIKTMTMGREKYEILKTGKQLSQLTQQYSHIQFGVCVPSSCSPSDVELALNEGLQWLSQLAGLKSSALILEGSCTVQQVKPWTSSEIVFLVLLVLLVGTGVVAMAYDMLYPDRKYDTTACQVLRAFSMGTSFSRLSTSNTSGAFTCLDGLRVLSTCWVVVCHKCLIYPSFPYINKDKMYLEISNPSKMPFMNSMQSVDTFVTISGFLRGYNLLQDFTHNRHSFVTSLWKRYLRLTPAYAVMLALYATSIVERLSDGPIWSRFMGAQADACKVTWPYHLLYLNNYLHSENYCMVQSWYLAADMHLFILTPLLMYPVWRWPHRAKNLLLIAGSIATIIPFICTLSTSALPIYLPSGSDSQFNHFMSKIHFPTHNRVSSYVVGLALGLLMFHVKPKKPTLSKGAVLAGWSISMYALYEVTFGIFDMMQYDYEYQPLRVALYYALHRPAWAFAIGWIIFACHHGYGGWINNFLSGNIFQPLSKLSYCIFLTHYLITLSDYGRIQTSTHRSNYTTFRDLIADFVVSTIISIPLHIFVEAPALEIIKIIQTKVSEKRVREKTADCN